MLASWLLCCLPICVSDDDFDSKKTANWVKWILTDEKCFSFSPHLQLKSRPSSVVWWLTLLYHSRKVLGLKPVQGGVRIIGDGMNVSTNSCIYELALQKTGDLSMMYPATGPMTARIGSSQNAMLNWSRDVTVYSVYPQYEAASMHTVLVRQISPEGCKLRLFFLL